ncbi:MAG: (d)CMP kinase [Pseudomonadota bacterium]|nr:(d)CMP kinase [Pseudomonadota bacterium]
MNSDSSFGVPVVTIDGPSGAGKGTLAAAIAEARGWHLLDSGALYRIIAVVALRQGVSLSDAALLAALCSELQIVFGAGSVTVNGDDLTDAIRTEDVGSAASVVAALPPVREAILTLQQGFRMAPGLVADGRDMGTVVFPDAPVKIFLDASAEARAERRYNQLKNKGLSVKFPTLLEQIQERDARDRERAVAPLRPAEDALIIDSSQMSIDAVVATVIEHILRTTG